MLGTNETPTKITYLIALCLSMPIIPMLAHLFSS